MKLNRFILLGKWHSLTTNIVKFVTDLLLKNDGITNIFLVDICIERSKDISQANFHNEN